VADKVIGLGPWDRNNNPASHISIISIIPENWVRSLHDCLVRKIRFAVR
jgi:hypothetical protein